MAVTEKDLIAFSALVEQKLKGVKSDMNNGFKNLNTKLDNQAKDLNRIELQTIKTNGRVSDLEKKTANMELDEVRHIINCPQISEIEVLRNDLEKKKADSNLKIATLNDELLEYKVLKKYPRIGLAVVTGACILLVVSVFLTLAELKKEARTYYQNERTQNSTNINH